MAKQAKTRSKSKKAPDFSRESVENRLINKTVKLVEKQLDEGTASPSVITHYLRLASTRAELEKEKLKNETELLRNKSETLESGKNTERLYEEAMEAMKSYGSP
ncbi:MAG: hypothetical protein HUJ62_00290 [Streptococcus gallolyticus]|nr:hypothetical protein [Streptococcus gallolyticus]